MLGTVAGGGGGGSTRRGRRRELRQHRHARGGGGDLRGRRRRGRRDRGGLSRLVLRRGDVRGRLFARLRRLPRRPRGVHGSRLGRPKALAHLVELLREGHQRGVFGSRRGLRGQAFGVEPKGRERGREEIRGRGVREILPRRRRPEVGEGRGKAGARTPGGRERGKDRRGPGRGRPAGARDRAQRPGRRPMRAARRRARRARRGRVAMMARGVRGIPRGARRARGRGRPRTGCTSARGFARGRHRVRDGTPCRARASGVARGRERTTTARLQNLRKRQTQTVSCARALPIRRRARSFEQRPRA